MRIILFVVICLRKKRRGRINIMNEVYSPISVYNIKFDEIKSKILTIYPDSKDYGSIIVIRCPDCSSTFYVLRDGTIQVLGNSCESVSDMKKETIKKIISIFTEQIKDISYRHSHPIFCNHCDLY